MKTRMLLCGWFVAVVVAFAAVAEATTLSVNFVGGRGVNGPGAAAVTGVAGSIQAPNWNNAFYMID